MNKAVGVAALVLFVAVVVSMTDGVPPEASQIEKGVRDRVERDLGRKVRHVHTASLPGGKYRGVFVDEDGRSGTFTATVQGREATVEIHDAAGGQRPNASRPRRAVVEQGCPSRRGRRSA